MKKGKIVKGKEDTAFDFNSPILQAIKQHVERSDTLLFAVVIIIATFTSQEKLIIKDTRSKKKNTFFGYVIALETRKL